MSRARKALQAGGWVLGGLVVVGLGLVGFVEWKARQPWDAPYPAIAADTRPQALARGRALFEVKCDGCHRADDAPRATGKQLTDLPAALGTFHSANLTKDALAGIGARSDGELARALRFGVTHDGRRSVMGWALSDEDLAAVLGFLRSDDPRFDADPTVQPLTRPTLLGRAIMTFAMPVPELPAQGLEAPPHEDRVAWGRYLATAVYDCGVCHTPGFGDGKVRGPDAFRGGFEFVGADGRTVFSRNLTFHETGLGGWTRADFITAVRDGVSPRGEVLRSPMPRFRGASDEELGALFDFLASLPAGESRAPVAERPAPLVRVPGGGAVQAEPTPVATAGGARVEGAAGDEGEAPATLFRRLGCVGCHGPGAPYRAKLEAARGKPAETLARWIRHPEASRPGTQMPTYATLLDDATARRLAAWVSAGAVE